MSRVLAIDPGNVESAYCVIERGTLKPAEFGKVRNEELAKRLVEGPAFDEFVIERVASYGMAVGKEVFQTCEWIGRFVQCAIEGAKTVGEIIPVNYVYRKDEKLHICGDSRAKDANIRRALIDRFAKSDMKNGKGTKKEPDWFYGFSADVWSAYAVGVTYAERGASETI